VEWKSLTIFDKGQGQVSDWPEHGTETLYFHKIGWLGGRIS